MRMEMDWEAVLNRLEDSRQEASTRRLLGHRTHVNLWARLLPPLRRLEGWIERHAGSEAQTPVAASR